MAIVIEETLVHVLFLARHMENCNLQSMAVVALLELGIPTKRVGFDLVKKSIIIAYERPGLTTKEIFHEIGQKYEPRMTSMQIDQSIRDAISEAWKFHDDEMWRCYLPQIMAQGMRKPTNAEFITQLARLMELWVGCRKEPLYER